MGAKLPLEKSTATAIIQRGTWAAVKYHQTEVIGWDEKTIKLDTGGWVTSVTTLRRINQASERFNLGVSVFKHHGDTFAQFPGEEPIPMYDGLILSRDRSNPLPEERTIPDGRDYNGWPNRATWNVMLWMNNEEGHYRAYVAQARREAFTEQSAARFVMRRFHYQSMWNARTPDGEPLHRVHWGRVAEAMNEVRAEDARQAAAEAAKAKGYTKPKQITMIRRDDPDKCADYWIIYTKDAMICSSDKPAHPQGVWSYQEVDDWSKYNRRIGERSSWDALPETLQRQLVSFFAE